MSKLTPQQFALVESLFFEAGKIPEQQRQAFLAAACEDPTVRHEVESLLRQSSGGSDAQDGKTVAIGLSSASPLIEEVGRALTPTRHSVHALIGKHIGAYEILSVIGHGGMGVVYLARDTRLGREVAIKAIPPAYTSHPTRMARFVREAKMLASLSHPNIATVYGLEEYEHAQLLVMELVEGKTLSKKLSDGALPIGEALSIARQIAEGVEAAHDAGVIHRDLKPGNVMITPEGRAKVLDFGLARELRGANLAEATQPGAGSITGMAGGADAHHTREGTILGTPGYMSPEQVRGAAVDRRTDIFSFGCILYECLTGRVAFAGNTQADVLAAVLDREPDWSALPPRTPERVRRLLHRCTAKDLSYRLRDIGDAWLELDEAIKEKLWLADAQTQTPENVRVAGWRALFPWIPWALAAALVVMVVVLARRPATVPPVADAIPTPAAPLHRFSLPFPGGQPQADLAHLGLALSRDGSKLAVSATDENGLNVWIRDRVEAQYRRIDETRNGWIPAFSPDGQWIVYYVNNELVKRRLTGGGGVGVVAISSHSGTHYWCENDMVIFTPFWGRGVARASAHGGQYQMLTQPKYDNQEYGHITPIALPGSDNLLVYGVWDGATKTRIDVVDLTTGQTRTLVPHGSTPHLGQTPVGTYLLYERAGTIFAAPLDAATAQITGPETALIDGVLKDKTLFTAAFDVASDGTLAYIPGPEFSEESRLSWLDVKTGIASPINDDRLSFVDPHVSLDGRRLSVILKDDVYKPVLYDLTTSLFTPLLVDGDTMGAAISPDGTKLLYSNNRDGPYALYVRDIQNRQEEKLVDEYGDCQNTMAWTLDGRYVAFSSSPDDKKARDIAYVDLVSKELHSFCDSPAEERAPSFSPDGRWMAFTSNQSGKREVHVRSFPDGGQTRQISFGGGDWPRWALNSSDGEPLTLYYRAPTGLHAIQVSSHDGSTIDRPKLLYDKNFGQSDTNLIDYDVTADGRLLIIEQSERAPKVSEIQILLNWHQLLAPRKS